MNYYIDLFSPETAEAFAQSDRKISGFSIKRKAHAEKIKPGDKFICYLTEHMRFIGVLEVKSTSFINDKPIFYKQDDPFVVRFKVKPIVTARRRKAPAIAPTAEVQANKEL